YPAGTPSQCRRTPPPADDRQASPTSHAWHPATCTGPCTARHPSDGPPPRTQADPAARPDEPERYSEPAQRPCCYEHASTDLLERDHSQPYEPPARFGMPVSGKRKKTPRIVHRIFH